jgi:dihydroorotase
MNPARRLFSRTLATMSSTNSITIPAPFDAHVHLRQGNLMKLVTPHVEQGGVRMAFVMVRSRLSVFSSTMKE